MTDRIALILGLSIIGAIAADVTLNDAAATTFTLRRGIDFIEWLAFWR